MKFIRTTRGYEALTVPGADDKAEPVTVTSDPLKVSNAEAERLQELGEQHGVALTVQDEDEETGLPVVQPTPDLSAGVSAVSGTGDPVMTTDVTAGDAPGTTTKKKAGN